MLCCRLWGHAADGACHLVSGCRDRRQVSSQDASHSTQLPPPFEHPPPPRPHRTRLPPCVNSGNPPLTSRRRERPHPATFSARLLSLSRSSRSCIRSLRTTSPAERGWRAAASAARKRRQYCAACPTSGPHSSLGWEPVLVFRDTGDGRTSRTTSFGATCRSRYLRTACAGCGWKARCVLRRFVFFRIFLGYFQDICQHFLPASPKTSMSGERK